MTVAGLVSAARFTVFLGKNGAGKSTLLRSMSYGVRRNVKYVSPERGGILRYDPHVENNIISNAQWVSESRQTNRLEQFRQQSAVQFRNLEMMILREIEENPTIRGDMNYDFNSVVLEKINALLPALRIARSDRGFSFLDKDGDIIEENSISSGESELISLAIEVLVFSRMSVENKILLLDEPDVHLHPDLQQRFTRFVQIVAEERDMRVAIATHSTAIIGAFSPDADLQIAPVTSRNQTEFQIFRPSRVAQEILPVFGIHPLSTAFNKTPVMLIEGEDDKRVIEEVVRSSGGRYAWAPCPVGSVSALSEWENWINRVLPALYDEPIAYSLRDLDDASQSDLDDVGIVRRVRLNCYAIENILLTEQAFSACGITAEQFLVRLNDWLDKFPNHQATLGVQALVENFESRRTLKIKNIRNVVVAVMGESKPWEVLVGRVIAESWRSADDESPHSIKHYLGRKASTVLFS